LLSGKTGIFNVSSGKPVQIIDVVYKIAILLNANPKIILDLTTERPGEPSLLVGENSKLKSLGWRPEYTLDEGLERVVKKYI
jgi:nucleoside-diphosphate-sugar epimerase